MVRYPSYRYRCEHCRKTSGSGGHMKRHESTCTSNPNRACGMCKQPKPIAEMVAALGKGDDAGVNALRDVANGCPACMLAAVRQSKLQTAYNGPDDEGFRVPFDFKAEKAAWWEDTNEADREAEMHAILLDGVYASQQEARERLQEAIDEERDRAEEARDDMYQRHQRERDEVGW